MSLLQNKSIEVADAVTKVRKSASVTQDQAAWCVIAAQIGILADEVRALRESLDAMEIKAIRVLHESGGSEREKEENVGEQVGYSVSVNER